MGTTKKEFFTDRQNTIARLAKACGHPARIAIIEYLLKVNQCICGDIVLELPLAQPTISQHLKELKLAGIVSGTIEGNSVCYCINKDAIQELQHYFETISANVSTRNISHC